MSYKKLQSMFSYTIIHLNNILFLPKCILQSKIALKTDVFPTFVHAPINYILSLILFLFIVIGYANNFICYIVGIAYPLAYSLPLVAYLSSNGRNNIYYMESDKVMEKDSSKLILVYKYWMLFGAITIIDSMLNYVFELVPGYYYFKFLFIYALVRNDFYFSNYIFNLLYNRLSNTYVTGIIYKRTEPKPEDINKVE